MKAHHELRRTRGSLALEAIITTSSQDSIATPLGVSRQLVGHWVTGRRTPALRYVDRMFELWGIHPELWRVVAIPGPPALPTLPSAATMPCPPPSTMRAPASMTHEDLEVLSATGEASKDTVRRLATELRLARVREVEARAHLEHARDHLRRALEDAPSSHPRLALAGGDA